MCSCAVSLAHTITHVLSTHSGQGRYLFSNRCLPDRGAGILQEGQVCGWTLLGRSLRIVPTGLGKTGQDRRVTPPVDFRMSISKSHTTGIVMIVGRVINPVLNFR